MTQFISSDTIFALIDKVKTQAEAYRNGDTKARKEMLVLARSLYLAIETPMEAILRMEWAEPQLNAAICTAFDLQLFEEMAKNKGVQNSTTELALATGADAVLLGRILKHLAAMSVIQEVGANEYQSTALSDSLTIPSYQAGVHMGGALFRRTLLAVPEHLRQTQYRNPTGLEPGALQLALQTSEHMFEYFASHPQIGKYFNDHMIGYSSSRARWVDPGCVPIDQVLGNGAGEKEKDVLLVDIGGGSGHDLELFRQRYPDIPGRLVLQDLPTVIAAYKSGLESGTEPMEYDFFTPQPVKGARGYYLHSILHDWSDEKCREILRNITAAMTKGYSKILINENAIPETDAFWEQTGLDLVLMACLSSGERTESQWRQLLESVGLRVVNIWTYEKGTESLIEAELL